MPGGAGIQAMSSPPADRKTGGPRYLPTDSSAPPWRSERHPSSSEEGESSYHPIQRTPPAGVPKVQPDRARRGGCCPYSRCPPYRRASGRRNRSRFQRGIARGPFPEPGRARDGLAVGHGAAGGAVAVAPVGTGAQNHALLPGNGLGRVKHVGLIAPTHARAGDAADDLAARDEANRPSAVRLGQRFERRRVRLRHLLVIRVPGVGINLA